MAHFAKGKVYVVTVVIALAAWLGVPNSASASIVNFAATVEQAQETPPTGSPSTWTATAVMDTDLNTLSYNITNTGPPLVAPEIAAHFHGPAPIGVPAGIVEFINPPLAGPVKIGVWNFDEAEQAMILSELTYINIHSLAFGGGEVRGQVLRVPSCGDGILDGGEQCDDGNNVNGDCCDSVCQAEADGNVCDDGNAGTPVDTCNNGVCGGANSMACYQVKDLKVPAKFVSPASISVNDQVSTGSVSKCKPKFLCVPTELDGGPIVNPGLDYICYQCKGAKPAFAFDITDQFGTIRVQTKKIKFVCDPSQLTPAP